MTSLKRKTFEIRINEKSKLTKHYCIVCKKRHYEEDWRWKKVKIGGKTKYYCHHGIDCKGCGKIHYNDTGRVKITNEGEYCGRWFKPQVTLEQKVKNLSPQEVLSGVHFGMDEQKDLFRKEAMRDDYSVIRREEIKNLKEALSS